MQTRNTKRSKVMACKEFIGEDFLLQSEVAKHLFHEYASPMAIIDFHCHLSPKDIAEDRKFNNITQLWIDGDHYKWRAMRADGVDESYCSGNASDKEKFLKWAATVPSTLRNPLFHWSQLELKRYFGIDELLNADNAEYIYDQCNEMLQSSDYSVQGLLRKMKVETICTTDDPADSLIYHKKLAEQNVALKVYPGFRPDKAMALGTVTEFNEWIASLEKVSLNSIVSFDDLLNVLKLRIEFFNSHGCRISDHGIAEMYAEYFTEVEVREIFLKLRSGKEITIEEKKKYASAVLFFLSKMYYESGWVQQFHIGAIRNNRTKLFNKKGADLGFDSIGDSQNAASLSNFFDKLDLEDKLAKTILYNLNPSDNDVFASMLANYNDGQVKGKMQYGPAWWFLDQKEGITSQINTISNYGLLSTFVGMVTDSRSFLSYPRHEYFRRILCDILGREIENGELPDELPLIGKLVQNICYYNSKKYFNF